MRRVVSKPLGVVVALEAPAQVVVRVGVLLVAAQVANVAVDDTA